MQPETCNMQHALSRRCSTPRCKMQLVRCNVQTARCKVWPSECEAALLGWLGDFRTVFNYTRDRSFTVQALALQSLIEIVKVYHAACNEEDATFNIYACVRVCM